MNSRTVKLGRARGSALVVTVIMLVLATLIMLHVSRGAARDMDVAVDHVNTIQAFYAAEAGAHMAIRELANLSDEDGDGTVGTISDDSNSTNDPTFGSAQVVVTASSGGVRPTLTSTGRAAEVERVIELLGQTITPDGPGLTVTRYVAATSPSSVDDFDWTATPDDSAIVLHLHVEQHGSSVAGWPGGPSSNWGQRFVGSITIPQTGTWTLYTQSDDGSELRIDDTLVVDNDGLHAMSTANGAIALTAGKHSIDVRWFERSGNHGLIVYWSGPGVPSQTIIPASAFTQEMQ